MGAGLLVLACLVGMALWLGSNLDDDRAQPPAEGTTAPASAAAAGDPNALATVPRPQSQQTASFSLLRTPPEGLPHKTRAQLGKPGFGINPALAQKLPEAAPGDFWATPGNGFVCLLSDTRTNAVGMACATNDQAAVRGVATILLTARPGDPSVPRSRIVIGIAPDGTRAMHVKTGASRTTVAVTEQGVFVLRDALTRPPDLIAPI
jgi:hypothetical protein